MNNARRKELEAAKVKIEQAVALFAEARDMIEYAQSDEQDYFDNMPESIQEGEKGQKAQEAIDNLNSALEEIDNLDFDDLNNNIDAACD